MKLCVSSAIETNVSEDQLCVPAPLRDAPLVTHPDGGLQCCQVLCFPAKLGCFNSIAVGCFSFVAIGNNTLYGSKLSIFLLMPKIIRILRSCSMKIFCTFPTVNISKLNFWLVICIAKNFIWTTLKLIFSIFRFFCTLRFQIYKYCPIITNHTSMESYVFSLYMMYTSHKVYR